MSLAEALSRSSLPAPPNRTRFPSPPPSCLSLMLRPWSSKQGKSKEELGKALIEASENGNKEELKQLLAAGAPLDARGSVRRMHGRVNGQSA